MNFTLSSSIPASIPKRVGASTMERQAPHYLHHNILNSAFLLSGIFQPPTSLLWNNLRLKKINVLPANSAKYKHLIHKG